MSNINSNATVTLNVNGKQAQEMLDNLKKKSQDLEQAISKAAKAGDKASLKKLQSELKQTNRQISQIESAAMDVQRVMKNLDKATPKELNKTLRELKKQLNGIERGTKEWESQCAAIKRVKAEIDKVNEEMKVNEGRFAKMNRLFNEWQTAILGAAAAVTGLIMAGRSAVSAYAEMEAEMANVRKFTGMTEEQVKDLNEEFKKMDTRTSREDLNKLAQEAGRLGKTSKEDVLGFVKAADQINVALDDLGEGATLTLSKLTTIFGDEKVLGTEKSLLAVGSVINELSQNCTASAPYLANFAQRLAGVGAQANMTIPQVMGLAAVLDSQGQAAEMSATALSKLIMDMFKDTDKIIKATGMNAKQFKDTLAKDTNEALIMLLDRLHELGNIDVLAPVFKDMGENGARASSVIAALAGNIETVKWEQEEANKAYKEGTSVTAEFNVQNNTVQAGLDKAKKRVKEVAIELGEKLQPIMRHIISGTTMLLKVMLTTVNFISKYRTEIIAAAAALAAYTVATNLATIKTKAAAAAHVLWNGAIKVFNVLLPIGQVLLNGLKLAIERVVWQTRGANATQQAYNKSLAALKANAAAAKVAWGMIAVAVVAATVALVRYLRSQSESNKAAERMKAINEEVKKNTAEEITKINQLRETIEDETVSVDKRRKAIEDLQKIVPSYHASIDTEGRLYNHNTKVLDIYIEKLKSAARVQAALAKLPEAEQERDNWFNDAPKNLQEAYFNEKVNGMNESQAAGRANASLAGYRAWKRGLAKRENAVTQYNDIVESESRKSEELNDQLDKNSPPKADPKDYVPTKSTGNGSGNSHTEDKLKIEKAWKAKEEALNRIAYAKGEKNYEDYTNRMLEIEKEYNEKILARTDLTEQERLDAQVGYYEAQQKEREEKLKQSVEQEEKHYNESVANEKQRYIDGKVERETYEATLEMLEMEHLERLVNITKAGSKERLQAERAYQDKLLEDVKKKQQEVEQAEKEHQQRLAELKGEYFGDNAKEKYDKYNADLIALQEIYNAEILAAGENAKEKLRIDEAYEKAKKALRKKYGIDAMEEEKNGMQKWVEDTNEWLEDPEKGQIWLKSFSTMVSGMSSIFQQLTSLVNAETEKQTAAIESRYDKEKSKAEGNNYQVQKLEEKKQKELAKIKNDANKKLFTMQVIQAVAETAQGAINAYTSAAAIPMIGWTIAPIAAAMAVAAGMLQVAAIKKQQQASEAQGYAEGGFTGPGGKYEVAGVVHKGEWVANQSLVQSPVARPMIDALDYAQRTNTIGSLRQKDVSRLGSMGAGPMIVMESAQSPQGDIATNYALREYASVIRRLKERLDEPFVTVNTVSGDTGIKKAQDEYNKLIRNKTPKSRRK